MTPVVTLDQWRALQAVVDHGGFAQAAEALHRSQSAVSYAVARLQSQLGVMLLRIEGRKAVLTDTGATLLGRVRQLLEDASAMEGLARRMGEGWEAEIRLVVDVATPSAMLMKALAAFAAACPGTRVQLHEVVLSGADEALEEGHADLAVAVQAPGGFLGDPLLEIEFLAVAHPDHALHRLGRELDSDDLRRQVQVVIRDSARYRRRDSGWLGAEQRWTVSRIETAIEAVRGGLGFGWLPRHQVEPLLCAGELKVLPLRAGRRHCATLYLVHGRAQMPGPAAAQLAALLRAAATEYR